MVDINEYTREAICEYKGEIYTVRDNGAVMRHIREGKKVRQLDNVWTFGTKDKTNGYMMINAHRVHIIVAKAFIPGNEDGKMVVDHIDTNRCNNRVENLRWLTKLENVLMNEATLKRVTYLCGGDINKFIENPSCLRDLSGTNQDIMWMRTVSAEEARRAWEHISAWAKRPISTYQMMKQKERPKDFDEWLKIHKTKGTHIDLYNSSKEILFHGEGETDDSSNRLKPRNNNANWIMPQSKSNADINPEHEAWLNKMRFAEQINESLTNGALQLNFLEKMRFPLCPEDTTGGLDTYANNLELNKTIAISENGDEYIITSVGWTCEWDEIQIGYTLNGRNNLYYIHISISEGKYLHSRGNYKQSYRFCDSPNVLQCGTLAQCYFPLCPKDGNITLEEYAKNLHKDELFEKSQYGDCYVVDREITKSKDGTPILYVGARISNPIKDFGDLCIFIENGKVIHEIGTTYFSDLSLKRTFCKMRGQEWDDSIELFDDYC